MRSAVVFNALLESTLFGSGLIVLVLLARRLFRKPLGNRLIYFAWLLVALRLMLPVTLPNPLMNGLRPISVSDPALRPVAGQVRVRLTDAALNAAYGLSRYDGQAVRQSALYQAGVSLERGELGRWALALYGAGGAAVAGWMLLGNRRFRKRVLNGRVDALSGQPLKDYLALCQSRRVRPLPVWLIDPLPSPCLIGAARPFIALPLSLPPAQVLPALTHEVCHYKARDQWWNVARNACCVLHWFNPLVWAAAACSKQDSELACDDRVTARLSPEAKRRYAETLVSAAAPQAPLSFGVLATGMTVKGKRLKQRIRGILADRRVRMGAVAAFAVVATAAVLIAFATSELRREAAPANRRYAINHVAVPTAEEQRAARRELNSSVEAEAYFQQLLNSPYLAAHGDAPQPAELINSKWYVREERGDHTGVSAVFDTEGVITAYANVGAMEAKPLRSSATPYTVGGGDNSIADYLKAFAYETLPDISFTAIRITADQQSAAARYVTCVTENAYTAAAHEFIVQVEPSAQVVSFRLLDDESRTVIRSSRKRISVDGAPQPTPTAAPTVVPTPQAEAFDSLQAFVEKSLMPQLTSRSTRQLTQANTVPWLAAAESAGMSFTEEWRAELSSRDSSADFLFRLALSQLGPQAMWTAEQDQWVEAMMAQASGDGDGALTHQLPLGGELDQAQAIALARRTLKERYALSDAALDRMTASASFTTQIFDDWGKEEAIAAGVRLWSVAFYENGPLAAAAYRVAFSPTGDPIEAVKCGEDTLVAYCQRLTAQRGRFEAWPYEAKAAFTESWPFLATAYGQGIPSLYADSLFHRFGLPDGVAVTAETACQSALEALNALYQPGAGLEAAAYGYITDDPENPYWLVGFYRGGFQAYFARVSYEGMVLEVGQERPGVTVVSEARTAVTPAVTPAPGLLKQADAVAVARQALINAYDLSFAEAQRLVVVEPQYIADGSRNWYGLSPTQPYWWVGFRRPQTEERFYADYSVLVDAATGEALQVRDPGNITNG